MAKQKPPQEQEWPEQKSEDYKLLGGINTKVSLYTNDPAEFRDLSNLNFVNMGALTSRPGTTLFPGLTFSGTTGGGVSAGIPDLRGVASGYEFSNLSGSSYMVISQFNNLFNVFPSGYSPLISYLGTTPPPSLYGSVYSYATFVDHLFAANGTQFYRIATINNGGSGQLNAFNYSLPVGGVGPTYTGSLPFCALTGASYAGGLSGVYVFGYSYVNDRGFIGPPSQGITLTLNGGALGAAQYIFSGLSSIINVYGATAVMLMRSEIDGVVMAGTTMVPISSGGATQIFFDSGTTLLNTAIVASQDTDVTSGGYTLGIPLYPRYLEVFNNQLFMAGMSTMLSTFWWSEIGEPEGVQPQYSVEVRSNDGDKITGMKSYLGSLVISKLKSVHLLSGTDPTNFVLQELSDQYGCVSHRTLVVWNNNLWFLDVKGIMEYNGANIKCVSDKIEGLFKQMNINAAVDNACGLHVKEYNEIWFSIPVNGSTINNRIIVFDYVANAWTHYDGINAQCLFNARGGMPNFHPFYGGYTGGLMYFDPALTSDNDSGFTCSFNSMFFSARGQTVQNMYRRFYLDVNPVLGFTQPINFTFQTNFGTTVQSTNVMYQNPFQSRIDFGLSARSLQASMFYYSASLQLIVNGFTVESRFLRNV